MTEKERLLAERNLSSKQHGCDYQSKEYQILSCISMINSILAYGYDDNAEYVLEREEHRYHNYLKEYVEKLGREKVLSLIKGQIRDIKEIEEGVYTDCEGLTYNSIVWVR